MSRLTDWLTQPRGEARTSKVMCFLQGGRYAGDRASIHAPAPDLLAVAPCDCSPASIEAPCGQPTHWHDVADLGDVLGDTPAHAAYYVLVSTRPARSGLTAALYWHAGYQRPTRRAMARAADIFERAVRDKAALTAGSNLLAKG